jgi:ubiquitin-protein ligase E3 C
VDEDSEMTTEELPRYARARQRWTKRQMAFISPRLGLLNNLPMAVPFQTRLQVFRQFVE